jgi:hypothetical protein
MILAVEIPPRPDECQMVKGSPTTSGLLYKKKFKNLEPLAKVSFVNLLKKISLIGAPMLR